MKIVIVSALPEVILEHSMNIDNGVAEGEAVKLTCHTQAAHIHSQVWYFQVIMYVRKNRWLNSRIERRKNKLIVRETKQLRLRKF